MTFFGLWVDKDGNLLDYNKKQVIERNFMDKGLRRELYHNSVNFQEDYMNWNKYKITLYSLKHLYAII